MSSLHRRTCGCSYYVPFFYGHIYNRMRFNVLLWPAEKLAVNRRQIKRRTAMIGL